MTAMTDPPDWIAVDWGTSRLRAWAMGPDATVRAEAESGEGMGALAPDGFEGALLRLVGPWLAAAARPVRVIACGMVGSRQGWVEAPYRAVPCPPLGAALIPAPARDLRLQVHVLPGLKQERPPDVMRGEETQIAGVLAGEPGFDGVVCLPGTHAKWAHVGTGEVVSFTSCMTGELFDLLSRASVLRHTAGEGWDDAAFAEGLSDSLARPERLATQLFGLRAAGLLGRLGPGAARARLSGLLIGAELAATRPWWLGRRVVVVGAERLSDLYARALALQGVAAERRGARAMTLAGLAAARALLPEGVA
jgi:2-dehydro-3-deoxygalactonokinase